jgi:hypothetical protein
METEVTLSSVWDKHVGAEFAAKDADEAVATITAESYVNLIPLMIGARGRDGVRDFYTNHFLSQLPPDIEIVPDARKLEALRPRDLHPRRGHELLASDQHRPNGA